MPPFAVVWLEAVAQHGPAQDHPVAELLFGDVHTAGVLSRLGIAAVVGMALYAEPVMHTTHVKLFAGGHVEKRKIDG